MSVSLVVSCGGSGGYGGGSGMNAYAGQQQQQAGYSSNVSLQSGDVRAQQHKPTTSLTSAVKQTTGMPQSAKVTLLAVLCVYIYICGCLYCVLTAYVFTFS